MQQWVNPGCWRKVKTFASMSSPAFRTFCEGFEKRLHFPAEQSVSVDVAEGGMGVPSKELGKVCLKAMMRRVVKSGEQARGAQELLKLGRFDEAMDVAYDIEPQLYEANHLMQSAALLRDGDRSFMKSKVRST